MQGEGLNSNEQIIKPVAFRGDGKRHPGHKGPAKWLIWMLLGFFILILAVGVWFIFSARQVVIVVEPEPDRVDILGSFLAPRFHSYFRLRQGEYTFQSEKECYHLLEQPLKVTSDKSQQFNFTMEKLSGFLAIKAYQEGSPDITIDGAAVLIDGSNSGVTPLQNTEITPGRRILEIHAYEYQSAKAEMDIDGCNIAQSIEVPLTPAWSDTTITSLPQGASVIIDGENKGMTPITLRLLAGKYALEIQAELFKKFSTQLDVLPNTPLEFGPFTLQPADGILQLTTVPTGVNITVDNQFAGRSPLDISLSSQSSHQVVFSKAGYENVTKGLSLEPGQTKKIDLALKPIKGKINIVVSPPDAQLFVNGKKWKSSGNTAQRQLQLITVSQQIEIRKEGYVPFKKQVIPHESFPLELIVSLKKKGRVGKSTPPAIQAANGYQFNLISPESFTMGSSRREQGRRSNETLRKVKLDRAFYMGIREVTNQEFRAFAADHDSGYVDGQSLNDDDMPVVMVTWDQAAEFCNWLSKKDGLPAVYVKQSGKMTALDPIPSGYRLPTEAEWEYCARKSKTGAPMKYPWGDTFPPPEKSGNFADVAAKSLVGFSLEKYNDGYKATAPPGIFGSNALGIDDLGGNVTEWCHDIYTIYPFKENYIYLDPTGPEEGAHHIVKGSSWKHASISTLRTSYRDYSKDKRNDIGFRLCRYFDDGAPGK